MRILMIRHGEPDYAHDALTEKGRREAELLAKYADRLRLGDCFVSPLGRAQATASYTLKKSGLTAETLDWLKEFWAEVDINDSEELRRAYPNAKKGGDIYEPRIVWDMVPSYYMNHPEYMDREGWRDSEVVRHSDMIRVYDYMTKSLDQLLAGYGYVREGLYYRVEQESTKTVVFFCHFGIICAILSHLLNISPFSLWHGLALAPTSVTEVVTEEREQGIALFRSLRMGDISHLLAGEEEPSFAARFCEVYSNTGQRH